MRYDLRVEHVEQQAWFDLKGARDDLAAWLAGVGLPPWPDRPNTATSVAGLTLIWFGPEQWLLSAPLEREAEIEAALRPDAAPDTVSLHVVSDSLAVVRVTGPDAAVAMAIATPLDLHPVRFADDAASFTEAFGVRALVTRAPGGFQIAVDRSLADFVVLRLGAIAG